jgi:hypothetical protein
MFSARSASEFAVNISSKLSVKTFCGHSLPISGNEQDIMISV